MFDDFAPWVLAAVLISVAFFGLRWLYLNEETRHAQERAACVTACTPDPVILCTQGTSNGYFAICESADGGTLIAKQVKCTIK